MKKVFAGFWVFGFTILFLLCSVLYLVYRQKHPQVLPDEILKPESNLTHRSDDPCTNAIYGEPNIPPSDSFIKINLICPSGKTSTNVLLYSALGKSPTALGAIKLLGEINGFSVRFEDRLILGDGEFTGKNWTVSVSGKKSLQDLPDMSILPKDVVEIGYE